MDSKIPALYISHSKAWFFQLDAIERLTNIRFHRFVTWSDLFDPNAAESYAGDGSAFPECEDFPMPAVDPAHLVEYMYIANRQANWKSMIRANSISGDSFYERAHKYKYYLWRFAAYLVRQKIRFVLMNELPNGGMDYVMWRAAELVGTPIVGLWPSHNPAAFFALDSLDGFENLASMPDFNEDVHFPLADQEMSWWYMNRDEVMQKTHEGQWREGIVSFVKRKYRRLCANYIYRYRFIENLSALRRARRAFDAASKGALHDQNMIPEQFVYFPLHLQYEVTSAPMGAEYVDQIDAIGKLRELVPTDVALLVKENPKQRHFMRDAMFFKRLSALPNTFYVSKQVPGDLLIKRCNFVASLNGTAGWEAICRGKPAVVFGRCWYEGFPGVFSLRRSPHATYQQIMNWSCSEDQLKAAYDLTRRKLLKGTIGATELAYLSPEELQSNEVCVTHEICRALLLMHGIDDVVCGGDVPQLCAIKRE